MPDTPTTEIWWRVGLIISLVIQVATIVTLAVFFYRYEHPSATVTLRERRLPPREKGGRGSPLTSDPMGGAVANREPAGEGKGSETFGLPANIHTRTTDLLRPGTLIRLRSLLTQRYLQTVHQSKPIQWNFLDTQRDLDDDNQQQPQSEVEVNCQGPNPEIDDVDASVWAVEAGPADGNTVYLKSVNRDLPHGARYLSFQYANAPKPAVRITRLLPSSAGGERLYCQIGAFQARELDPSAPEGSIIITGMKMKTDLAQRRRGGAGYFLGGSHFLGTNTRGEVISPQDVYYPPSSHAGARGMDSEVETAALFRVESV